MGRAKKSICFLLVCITLIALYVLVYYFCIVPKHYEEVVLTTPNIMRGNNQMEGVVLHHTATFTPSQSLRTLTSRRKKASCHVIISYDGKRFILAKPRQITMHAGRSYFNGKKGANRYTIGIEFQGCTNVFPLTNRQIASAAEYLEPIIKKNKIPIENIVTHKMIRDEWIKRNPSDGTPTKPDIVERDYQRVLHKLKDVYEADKRPSRNGL